MKSESSPGHSFTIAYQNVRGLNTKTAEFFNSVSITADEFDAIAITETWLSDCSVNDRELFPEEFMTFKRRSRGANSRGGGVMLGVKKFYKCSPVPVLNGYPNIDLLCVKTNFMFIILVYISPRSTIKDRENIFNLIDNWDDLHDVIQKSVNIIDSNSSD